MFFFCPRANIFARLILAGSMFGGSTSYVVDPRPAPAAAAAAVSWGRTPPYSVDLVGAVVRGAPPPTAAVVAVAR